MDVPAVDLTSMPTVISYGVGAFLAITLAADRWFKTRSADVTQVTIIRDDRDRWQMRAERAEAAIDDYRAKLNQIILDQSDMKSQNAVMIEQLKNLREENDELRAEVRRLAGGSNVRAIS